MARRVALCEFAGIQFQDWEHHYPKDFCTALSNFRSTPLLCLTVSVIDALALKTLDDAP